MSETKKNFLFAVICGLTAILVLYGGVRLQYAYKLRANTPVRLVDR